jgi:hypothetical protein
MFQDATLVQFVLLFAGVTVSFLLGRELQIGFVQVRARSERKSRR